VEIDMAATLAGTGYRGMFEERIKKAEEADGKVVLFNDEMHAPRARHSLSWPHPLRWWLVLPHLTSTAGTSRWTPRSSGGYRMHKQTMSESLPCINYLAHLITW
jgi:hypothetical protein